MSNIDESVTVNIPLPASEKHWNQATRILVGVTVFACFLILTAVAHADIFTSLISTVSSIGSIEGQISGSQSSVNSFNSTVVVPLQQLNSLKNWLSQAENAYQGFFNQVTSITVKSASLTNTASLETALRAGYSGGTGSQVSSSFQNVYGVRLSTSVANQQVATQVDIQDTTAQEAMSLAANSDAATAKLLSAAQTLEQAASSTAPGTADHVTAQSMTLQLHSNAMMHHLLASMLRQEAGKLASQSAQVKQSATNHSNAMQGIFGGNQ